MASFTASKSPSIPDQRGGSLHGGRPHSGMFAEIRMFAYLKNFTLFACFLGLGLGMMKRGHGRAEKLLAILMAAIVLTLTFAPQLPLTRLFFPDVGVYQWGGNLLSPQLLPAARALPVLGAVLRHVPDASVP